MDYSYTEKEKRKIEILKATQWGRFIVNRAVSRKKFYLYRFIEYSYLEDFLKTREIKATLLSKSNDPLEMLPAFSNRNEMEMWERNKAKSLSAVICLSRLISSGAMWGHYADGHKGVCLVFELPLQRLLKGVMPQSYHIDEEARSYAVNNDISLIKVLYKRKRPILSKNRLRPWNERAFSWYLQAVMTKAPEWEYEQEYKLILPDEVCTLRDNMVFFSGLWKYFKAVVLGLNCEHTVKEVQSYIRQYSCGKIRVSRAHLSETTYDIEESKYHDTCKNALDDWCLGDYTLYEESGKMGYLVKKDGISVFTDEAIPSTIGEL